jgi:hypothetical protein
MGGKSTSVPESSLLRIPDSHGINLETYCPIHHCKKRLRRKDYREINNFPRLRRNTEMGILKRLGLTSPFNWLFYSKCSGLFKIYSASILMKAAFSCPTLFQYTFSEFAEVGRPEIFSNVVVSLLSG